MSELETRVENEMKVDANFSKITFEKYVAYGKQIATEEFLAKGAEYSKEELEAVGAAREAEGKAAGRATVVSSLIPQARAILADWARIGSEIEAEEREAGESLDAMASDESTKAEVIAACRDLIKTSDAKHGPNVREHRAMLEELFLSFEKP